MTERKRRPKRPAEIAKSDLSAKARLLYLQEYTLNEISSELQVSVAAVARWRSEGSWALERENKVREIIEDGFTRRRLTADRIMNMTHTQLHRAVEHISRRPDPPSLAEAEKLANIHSVLDKTARLDSNKSTENVAVAARIQLTPDQIRQAIAEDPFLAK